MSAHALVPIGEVCTVNPRTKRGEYPDEMPVSFVPMAAVDERFGEITVREERCIAEVSKGYTAFQDGDVLFAKITPCMENGKAAVARNLTNGMGRGSTEFYVLRPSERILGEYVYYFVRQSQFRAEAKRNFTGTAGQQRVPKSFIENALIPLPPLHKQRQIVGILNRVARIERLRTQATERLREFIPALFVRMFGDAVGNSIGGRFPFARIGEICNLVNGRAFKPAEWVDAGLPIVRIQNLRDSSKPMNKFDGEVHEKHLVDSGDVLLSWSGTPGTSFGCFVWDRGRAILNQHIFRVEYDKSRMERDFFVHAVNSRLDEMMRRAHGAVGLRHITKAQLNKIKLPMPPLNEQREFARIIESARSLFAHETSGRCVADELNESIMSRLLPTGRADADDT